MYNVEGYLQTLAAAIRRESPWVENNDVQPPRGCRMYGMVGSREGAMILAPGDGLTPDRLHAELEAWSRLIGSEARFGGWQRVRVVYLFGEGCPDALRREILAATARIPSGPFQTGSRVVQAGYIDLATGGADLNDDASQPGPTTTQAQAAFWEWNQNQIPAIMMERRRSTTSTLRNRLLATRPWGTWLIVGLCALVFLLEMGLGGSEKSSVLLRLGADYGPWVRGGDWWRLVGSMFLHIGWLHLAVNMFSLINVGPLLERLLGNTQFLALYAVAGIAGALASAWSGSMLSAGASGAIFGICGGLVVIGYRFRRELAPLFGHVLTRNLVVIIGLNLLFGAAFNANQSDGPKVDNFAHLGGLLGGAAAAALMRPRALLGGAARTSPALAALMLVLAALPFPVEGYALYQAGHTHSVADYPSVEYRDPQGRFSLRHPQHMQTQIVGGETLFVSPDLMTLRVSVDDLSYKPDLVVDKEALLQPLKLGMSVTSLDTVQVGSRTWLQASGATETSQAATAAISTQGSRVFRVVATADDAETSQALMQSAIRDFRSGP